MQNDLEPYAIIVAGILSLEFLEGWSGVILNIALIIIAFFKIYEYIQKHRGKK